MFTARRAALASTFFCAILLPLLLPMGAQAAPGATSSTVAQQLAAVRQATIGYHDLSTALDNGYLATSDCTDLPGVGAMGYHFVNPARMGHLDPVHPDILLYAPSSEGPKLTGVEYFSPALFRHPDGSISLWSDRFHVPPADWIALPGPSLFGQPFKGPMAGHTDGMPWHYDLHVWLWRANPTGMFSQWNPDVHC